MQRHHGRALGHRGHVLVKRLLTLSLLSRRVLLLSVLRAERRCQRGGQAGHGLSVPGRRSRHSRGVLERAVVLLLERADLRQLQRVRRGRLCGVLGSVLRRLLLLLLLKLLQILQVLQLMRMDLLLLLLLLRLLGAAVQLLLSHGDLSSGLLIAESHPWDEKWLLHVHDYCLKAHQVSF